MYSFTQEYPQPSLPEGVVRKCYEEQCYESVMKLSREGEQGMAAVLSGAARQGWETWGKTRSRRRSGSRAYLWWSISAEALGCGRLGVRGDSVGNERGKRVWKGHRRPRKKGKDLGLIPKMKWESIREFGSKE